MSRCLVAARSGGGVLAGTKTALVTPNFAAFLFKVFIDSYLQIRSGPPRFCRILGPDLALVNTDRSFVLECSEGNNWLSGFLPAISFHGMCDVGALISGWDGSVDFEAGIANVIDELE